MTTTQLEKPAKVRTKPLQLHYRPREWDEVIGQRKAVVSLKSMVESKAKPHCILLVGPSGTGKTTLARIVARKLGAFKDVGIIELDGATTSGVDDIKALIEEMKYAPARGKVKVAIIDECHSISKNAWQAFLKSTEEPPSHVYYIFCTTEEKKVPATIKTRATSYILQDVPSTELVKYAKDVICPLEGIKLPLESITEIAKSSNGSPRQFLNFLDQCKDFNAIEDIREVLSIASMDEKDPIIKFAQLILNNCTSWEKYKAVIANIENFGGGKPALKAYLGKCFLGESDIRKVAITLEALDAMVPFPDSAADYQLLACRLINGLSKLSK